MSDQLRNRNSNFGGPSVHEYRLEGQKAIRKSTYARSNDNWVWGDAEVDTGDFYIEESKKPAWKTNESNSTK